MKIFSLLMQSKFPIIHLFRPHRHTRSSSLDLQRIKLSNNNATQEKEKEKEKDKEVASAQPPELPPPRISDKSFKMASVDAGFVDSTKRSDESFADFTQFPETNVRFFSFNNFRFVIEFFFPFFTHLCRSLEST